MRRKSRWFLISIPKDTQATESQFKEMFSKTMNDLFGVVSYLYTIKIIYLSVKLGYMIINCNREISNYVRLCTALASVSEEEKIPCRVIHCSGTLCSIQKVLTDILVNERILSDK
ncbi:ribonuclease P/MRP protein subunit POP5 [Cryptosporidium parvum]|nr:ribonuclease P/MRP protein subunit POP5 [Cryptosporidium sp. 43IA8]